MGNFQVVEVPLTCLDFNFHLLELSPPNCHETGFLRAGKGPKSTKKKSYIDFQPRNLCPYLEKKKSATLGPESFSKIANVALHLYKKIFPTLGERTFIYYFQCTGQGTSAQIQNVLVTKLSPKPNTLRLHMKFPIRFK